MHYLFSHLHKFPTNLDDVSEEKGEGLHQNIKLMEERYDRRWDSHMMADYSWSFVRDYDQQTQRKVVHKNSHLDTSQLAELTK